jgi:hypothetical protein
VVCVFRTDLIFFDKQVEKSMKVTSNYEDLATSAKDLDGEFDRLTRDTQDLHSVLTLASEEFNRLRTCVVTLPLLTFNRVHNRFRFNQRDCRVEFLITEFVRRIYDLLLKRGNTRMPLHITGSAGIGKSAALYVCYYTLRMRREEGVRVTYIADCGLWMLNGYRYILNELVQTFHSDQITSDECSETTAAGWAQYVMDGIIISVGDLRSERLDVFVSAIVEMIRRSGMFWFVIFDNHNKLYEDRYAQTYAKQPFAVISWLSQELEGNGCGLVVLSTTRNNEYYKIGENFVTEDVEAVQLHDGVEVHVAEPPLFSAVLRFSEFQIGLLLKRLGVMSALNYGEVDLLRATEIIKLYTEGIPNEFREYVKLIKAKPTGSLDWDKAHFHATRKDNIAKQMKTHSTKINIGREKFDVVLCQVVMGFCCTRLQYIDIFDKRYVNCTEIVGEHDRLILTPVNEIVHSMFNELYYEIGSRMVDNLMLEIKGMRYRSSSARYSHVEHYIIDKLGKLLPRSEVCWVLNYRTSNNVKAVYRRSIRHTGQFKVKNFTGNYVPDFPFENKATVYVPNSMTYKGVDFFMYLPCGDTDGSPILWAVQVCDTAVPDVHMDSDVTFFWPEEVGHHETRSSAVPSVPKHQQAWAEYCGFINKNSTDVKSTCVCKVAIVWFLLHEPTRGQEEIRPYLLWNDLVDLCPSIGDF